MGLWSWFDVETIAGVARGDRELESALPAGAMGAVRANERGERALAPSGLPPGVPIKITLGLIPSEEPP